VGRGGPRAAGAVAGWTALAVLTALAALAAAGGGDEPHGLATLGDAVLLGVVEGLTEFLPVSSTGHLILTQRVLGISGSPEAAGFAVGIQAGAILAVFWLHRRRVRAMAGGLLGRQPAERRIALALGTAFLPAAAAGLLLGDWIAGTLFGLRPVVAAWFVGGVAILLAAVVPRTRGTAGVPLEEVTPTMAVAIGACQVLALWPGTSRSLVTILGALVAGLSLAAALEFSFLLGLLTLAAATAWTAARHGTLLLESYGPGALAGGFLAALLSALVAVRWMVGFVARRGLTAFGVYRVLLAIAVAALLAAGVLEG
jgi:undecaprenyl-diphosphatase